MAMDRSVKQFWGFALAKGSSAPLLASGQALGALVHVHVQGERSAPCKGHSTVFSWTARVSLLLLSSLTDLCQFLARINSLPTALGGLLLFLEDFFRRQPSLRRCPLAILIFLATLARTVQAHSMQIDSNYFK